MAGKTRREFISEASRLGFGSIIDFNRLFSDLFSLKNEDEDNESDYSSQFGLDVMEIDFRHPSTTWNDYRHNGIFVRFNDGLGLGGQITETFYIPKPGLEEMEDDMADTLLQYSQSTEEHYEPDEETYALNRKKRAEALKKRPDLDREVLENQIDELKESAISLYNKNPAYQSEPSEKDERLMYGFGKWSFPDGNQEWIIEDTQNIINIEDRYHTFDNFDLWKNGEKLCIQFHQNQETQDIFEILPDPELYENIETAWKNIDEQNLNSEERILYQLATTYGDGRYL